MQSPAQAIIKFNAKMYKVIIYHTTMTKCDLFQVCQAGFTFKNQSVSITVSTGWRKKNQVIVSIDVENYKTSLGWCISVYWAQACKLKGHWIDSQGKYLGCRPGPQ